MENPSDKQEKTWSRIPLKDFYGPHDVKSLDYKKDLNAPGEYPYTRGIYANMYRGKVWTTRQISGHSSPEESNKRLKFLFDAGQTGFNVIGDDGGGYIDSDHPLMKAHVGVTGVPMSSLKDMEILMDGIDMAKVSAMISIGQPVFVQYLVLAEMRGISEEKLQVSMTNDFVGVTITCLREPGEQPWDMRRRIQLDLIEYAIKHLPLCHPYLSNEYNIREMGASAIQGVAFCFSLAFSTIEELLMRGIAIDEIAPKISFNFCTHIDIFEEIAKYRAARRLWAKSMKERFGAKDPRSMRFKFHTNTAGCMQVRQQLMNNIVRSTCASLAATLGGCQSLNTTPYDEPLKIPTEESHRLAIRTQQILFYEAGAGRVADPLGGSYYVEYLTDKIEAEVSKLIKKIDDMGGAFAAAKSGWITREIEKHAYEYQTEVERGERTIVGRNAFVIPEAAEKEPETLEINQEAVKKHLANLKSLRSTRDQKTLRRSIQNLRQAAADPKMNLVLPMKEAVKAYATVGEIMGTIREAYGLNYDPYNVLKSPFK